MPRHKDMQWSTPITNVLQSGGLFDQYFREWLEFSKARPAPSVQWHKEMMGKQDFTFQGEYRYWVWEHLDLNRQMFTWYVFVSNIKGACFEVRNDATPEEALIYWHQYLGFMGLESIIETNV